MILHNKKNHSVALHFVADSGNVVVQGNNSVSNIATGAEVVESASISKIIWGVSSNSYWDVRRGGTLLITCHGPEGTYDFAGQGVSVNANNTQNLVANIVGGGVGFIIVEMKKTNSTVAPIV